MRLHLHTILACLCLAGLAAPRVPAADTSNKRPVPQQRRERLIASLLNESPRDWSVLKPGEKRIGSVLKWHTAPEYARIMAGTPEQRRAGAESLNPILDLCDNSYYAPWTLTRPLAPILMSWDTVPESTRDAMRRVLENWNYECSAGTINMRFYCYVAGYLATQYWPDIQDSATPPRPAYAADYREKTPRSRNASELRQYCRQRIFEILDFFVLHNGIEHSNVYFLCDAEAVKMLAELARDEEMRQRATMALDYFMLNLATDWNAGHSVEPTFREKYFSLGDTEMTATDTIGWLHFNLPDGGRQPYHRFPVYMALGSYRMPPVFAAIAADREGIRSKREVSTMDERGREPSARNYKTFHHAPGYTLTCAVNAYRGEHGIKTAVFKEQRMVQLAWDSELPGNRFFVFQENIMQPYFGKTAPNPFGVGENPYSQRMQHGGAVVGICDVPDSYPFYRLAAAFIREGAIRNRIERDNWVFCDGGAVLFALYTAAPATWERNARKNKYPHPVDVRWCDSRRNAWVLQTASPERYTDTPESQRLERFADEVMNESRIDTREMNAPTPAFIYRNLEGDHLRVVFKPLDASLGRRHYVNGQARNYDQWPILDCPWAHQERGSPVVRVEYDGVRLTYDFAKWKVEGDRMAVPRNSAHRATERPNQP